MKTEHPYPPELLNAIAVASNIFYKNKENIEAYTKELEVMSGYIRAKEEVKRLSAEYLKNKTD